MALKDGGTMTGYSGNTKPTWVVDKERNKRAEAKETLWLFGIHAVRDALLNPNREKLRLVLTKNAADRLADALPHAGIKPEIVDPRKTRSLLCEFARLAEPLRTPGPPANMTTRP